MNQRPPRNEEHNQDPDPPPALDAGLAAFFGAESVPDPPGSSVLQRLLSRLGSKTRIRLRQHLSSEPPSSSLPGAASQGPEPLLSGRYRIDREIARGGIGVVMKGHDVDLGRDVAIKFLRDEYRLDPVLLQRFVEEAQIGGQLQHPGIVPVHEIGVSVDAPFFAMKLIAGQTFDALLDQRGEVTQDRQRPIAVFEAVSQTLAYAHAHAVIHRDLKPANIMVGAFGEIQVVDWGLAKVLHLNSEGEERGSSRAVETVHTGSELAPSEAGSVMGTPAYMPPEQALGQLELMNERSDVFALGAILCKILTGSPPYPGDATQALELAQRGDLGPAWQRLASCSADAELLSIARDCLQVEQAARPRSAAELAKRIASYTSSVEARAQQAVVVAAEQKVRLRAARKAQRLVIALAAAVLTVGASLWWIQQDRAQRVAAATRNSQHFLNEAQRLRGLAQFAATDSLVRWAEARSAVNRAQTALGSLEVDPDLRREVSELKETLQAEEQTTRLRIEQTRRDRQMSLQLEGIPIAPDRELVSSGFRQRDRQRVETESRDAFRAYGLDLDQHSPEEWAARIRKSDIPRSLVAGIDQWMMSQRSTSKELTQRLLDIANLADPNPWMVRARRLLLSEGQTIRDWEALLEEVEPFEVSAESIAACCRHSPVALLSDWTLRLLRTAYDRQADSCVLAVTLAIVAEESQPPDLAEALRYYTAARALRPGSANILYGQGRVLLMAGRGEEAAQVYRDALDLRPDFPWALGNLGAALALKGDLNEAIDAFERAVELEDRSALNYYNLGTALRRQGNLARAELHLRSALELDPNADTYQNLGAVLLDRNLVEDAEEILREGVERHSGNAALCSSLGVARFQRGALDEALDWFQRAVVLDPGFALAHNQLGTLFEARGHEREAEEAFTTAIRLDPACGEAHFNMGRLLLRHGDTAGAVQSFRHSIKPGTLLGNGYAGLGMAFVQQGEITEAVRVLEAGQDAFPGNPNVHSKLGVALMMAQRGEEAEEAFQRAVELGESGPEAHYYLGQLLRHKNLEGAVVHARQAIRGNLGIEGFVLLGSLLRQQGSWEEAEDTLLEALEMDPDHTLALINLGNLLAEQGETEFAIDSFWRAIESDPDNTAAPSNLALSLAKAGRLEEGLEVASEALEEHPGDAELCWALGSLLLEDQRGSEALPYLEIAHASGAAIPGWNYPTAEAIENSRTQVARDQRLAQILAGELTPRGVQDQLEAACYAHRQGHHRRAVRLAKDGFAADPSAAEESELAYRYDAACSAVLLCEETGSTESVDSEERAQLLAQALTWLREDLRIRGRHGGKNVLQRWLEDPDLAPVRDVSALAVIEEDVRNQWQELWREVRAAINKLGQ
jgi:serine/threonine-protein kinase